VAEDPVPVLEDGRRRRVAARTLHLPKPHWFLTEQVTNVNL
jgi:ABC-type transport system involved in cytochrome c biogenesis ATPase subunit